MDHTTMLTLFVMLGAGLVAIPLTVTEVDAKDKDYCGISEDGDNRQCSDSHKDCKDFSAEKCEKVEEDSGHYSPAMSESLSSIIRVTTLLLFFGQEPGLPEFLNSE